MPEYNCLSEHKDVTLWWHYFAKSLERGTDNASGYASDLAKIWSSENPLEIFIEICLVGKFDVEGTSALADIRLLICICSSVDILGY